MGQWLTGFWRNGEMEDQAKQVNGKGRSILWENGKLGEMAYGNERKWQFGSMGQLQKWRTGLLGNDKLGEWEMEKWLWGLWVNGKW